MTQKLLGTLFVIVAIAMFYYFITTTYREATMLLINGTVYTFDQQNTVAQAIAIRGNRIQAVGSNEGLVQHYQADTVIDLQGNTVFPGFIDGHAHILSEGSRLHDLDLVGTTSPQQIARLVQEHAKQFGRGQWIIGRGWDQNDWDVKEFPTHEILDRAAPDNPVLLKRIDGHAVWVNKQAMERAKIGSGTQDPAGGKIYRDVNGLPSGVFVDNAMDLIYSVVPELTEEEIETRLKLALEECAKFGVTEVHDMGVDLKTINVYKKLIDRDECPIRIYGVIGGPGETWDHYRNQGREIGYGGGMLTVRAIKLFIDGALGSRGAALVEEYSDDPGNRGLTIDSEEHFEAMCQQALEKGFQVCTHAIGDRGNNIVLNVYDTVLSRRSSNVESPRWRIEHAQVLLPSDVSRFAQRGVLASMQPTHATSDMYWAEARLGPERIKYAYAWRSLIDAGAIIVGGSDFPVEGVNPLWGFYAAVTRSDKNGYPQDGWYFEQKMTREETARCFTRWAAYGGFEEENKGTIEPGKLADLTVLSKDIMKIPVMEILSTEVEMTIVGGNIVYQKAVTTQVP
ncbi:MAG: amidohydrolase [Ignavibacteriae bacterium]|nr:amidohydrolase [Ignavibacteriota bacterium]